MNSSDKKQEHVLFFISCFSNENTGIGGHYYSLMDTARSLDLAYEIIVIGDFFPIALRNFPNARLVPCQLDQVWTFPYKEFLHRKRPTLLHAFDIRSAIYAGFLSFLVKRPLVVTKPGGPRLSRFTPLFRNMIVYQQSDYDDLKSRSNGPDHIALIPNRIIEPDLSARPEMDPFSFAPESDLRIITIGRINSRYENKILQSVALRRFLEEKGFTASLCIIGGLEYSETLKRLQDTVKGEHLVKIFTDEQFTYKASRYLIYSDIAVATGRGVYEAIAYGKFVFFPAEGSSLPCFLTSRNYQAAFEENFSPRVHVSENIRPDESLSCLLEIIKSESASYREWADRIFLRDHSMKTGARKIRAFYDTLSGHETLPLSIWRALKLFVRAKFGSPVMFGRQRTSHQTSGAASPASRG